MAAAESHSTPRVDEAWKERVQAESAPHTAAAEPPAARPQIDPRQLPPASLSTLVSMLGTQAMVALGVLPNPMTNEPDPQPALARHFIDLIAVIEAKTKENCTIDEQRLLNTTLHELRMAFVQLSTAPTPKSD